MLIPFYYLQVKNVSQDEIQGKIGKIYIPDQKVIINKNMSNLFLQSIYMKADRIKNNVWATNLTRTVGTMVRGMCTDTPKNDSIGGSSVS